MDHAKVKQNKEMLTDILRTLSMLEKALNRAGRKTYHNRSQYPELFFQIETMINTLRSRIETYQVFCGVSTFNAVLGFYIKEIGEMIGELILTCSPVKGKRGISKPRRAYEYRNLFKTINKMLSDMEEKLNKAETDETPVAAELEQALLKAFEVHCRQTHEKRIRADVSGRGKKTYIFPCPDKKGYLSLVNDRKKFRAEVVGKLGEYGHATGHKAACKGKKTYHLIGFRPSSRKTVVEGGEQGNFPIRMVQCAECGEKFSLLPSFLPREKNFGIDIIGTVLRGILLFGQSLRAALEFVKLTGREVKSKQTILNRVRWMGKLHPAMALIRSGVKGSGYFHEDEGFEKEPDLRTYTVVMADSENQLVWHMDYIDHADEETLYDSFEKFIERIDFKVLGVTKDKWQPATGALKRVCHQLWIGFCHRHCLTKFRKALSRYQKETGCTSKEVKSLYNKFKKALDTGTSKASPGVQINFLKDEAFRHPLLRDVLNEVKKNAVHYTAHKSRSGITKTTSLADNFLKLVKRKLRQAESFRDQESTGILFRAMANVRNFVPFGSGAKNAHKSPFMLADGETYDLPWIQVMNMHNLFLFTENAF